MMRYDSMVAAASLCGALVLAPLSAPAQTPAPGPEMVLVRPTSKTTAEVVQAIKDYVEAKQWAFMGAYEAKLGEVTMAKVCIPQVGRLLWSVGLQLSALLPCGNFGIYQRNGKTEVSMLHPRYMQVLYPNPDVERAAAAATPLLLDMLDTVTK